MCECVFNVCKKQVFGDILERKNAFLDYKNKKQKKSKNWPFHPQWLVHGFGPKMEFFPRFYFWQNRQEKSLCRYSTKKKRLLDYKKKE